MASGHGLSSDDHDDADVDVDPTAGWPGLQCGGSRLTRVRGVPLAGEALYCAGPVTRTRQVAAVTRSMTIVSTSAGGMLSAGGGSNSTLANALLTAQLMFSGMQSVARMNAGAAAVETTTPTTSPSSLTSGPPELPAEPAR